MANTHVIFQPLRMASQDVASYDRVVINSATPFDNGNLVIETTPALTSFGTKDMNTYTATAPSDVTTQRLLIVDSAEVGILDGFKVDVVDPRYAYVPVNTPAKARFLVAGDEFAVSAAAFVSAPTVGQYAIPANGSLLFTPSGSAPTTKVGFEVVATHTFSVGKVNVSGYRLKVLA